MLNVAKLQFQHFPKNLQFSLVAQSCPTFAIQLTAAGQASLFITSSWSLLKLISIDIVSNTIQPSHPLSSPSPPTFNLSKPQGLFK